MGSLITGYSVNDIYYSSPACETAMATAGDSTLKSSCVNNKKATENIIRNKNLVESEKEKYENMKDLYNREVLHFFNMSVGIGMLIYYVYQNQDAMPNIFM